MNTATIFEIREFSLFDGPGIRTTVFMKGCPLRCQWCHNPEGQRAEPELLVNELTCTHCGQCRKVCHHETCVVCGECARHCPTGSRRLCGREYGVDELYDLLMKHADIFAGEGGGVTFSGGEPTIYSKFIAEIGQRLKSTGIHCAMETCGYASLADYRRCVESLDFVFQDIKHPDPEQHKKWTGQDNMPILRNFQWLKQSGCPFVVRVPLIPTVNDSTDILERIARLCENCNSLQRVELLPYHMTAGAKYHLVGQTYSPDFPQCQAATPDLTPFLQRKINAVVL